MADRVLTNEQVAEIRERSTLGERGIDLAAEFGVSSSWVSRIINRRQRRSC